MKSYPGLHIAFSIEQERGSREPGDEYRYRIVRDGMLIARYWHDHRGDEHGIEFVTGFNESWPVGRMIDFIEGGGPQPLRLSNKALAYIEEKAILPAQTEGGLRRR